MSIPAGALQLRTGNVGLVVSFSGGATVTMDWQAYHAATDTVVQSGTVSESMHSLAEVEAITMVLHQEAATAFGAVVAKHEPKLGNLSAFDVDLLLDRWMFYGENGSCLATHPVCGDHAGVVLNPASLVSMVDALSVIILPPTTWVWAESVQAGTLRVKCLAIPGATSYSAFDGDVLMGNVANLTNWTEVPVGAGVYEIRVAGVKAGQVGALSFPIQVAVT